MLKKNILQLILFLAPKWVCLAYIGCGLVDDYIPANRLLLNNISTVEQTGRFNSSQECNNVLVNVIFSFLYAVINSPIEISILMLPVALCSPTLMSSHYNAE